MDYINGEKLDLSGTEVTLTYKDGTTRDVRFVNFAQERITTNPVNGAILSNSVHNNKRVEVTYTYNNNPIRTYTANLIVQKKIVPLIEIGGKIVDIDVPDGKKFTYVSECGKEDIDIDITRQNADIFVDGQPVQGAFYQPLSYGDNSLEIMVDVYSPLNPSNVLVHEDYTLTIKRPFPSEQLIKVRWDNTLAVINNSRTPYEFTKYKWYRNDREVGSGWYWSAGTNGEKLNPKDKYFVEATTEDGKSIRSCEIVLPNVALQGYGISLKNNSAYSNIGFEIFAPEAVSEMEVFVHDVAGKQVFKQKGSRAFNWNLTDDKHRMVSNGLYIVTAKAKGESGKIYRYSTKLVVKR